MKIMKTVEDQEESYEKEKKSISLTLEKNIFIS